MFVCVWRCVRLCVVLYSTSIKINLESASRNYLMMTNSSKFPQNMSHLVFLLEVAKYLLCDITFKMNIKVNITNWGDDVNYLNHIGVKGFTILSNKVRNNYFKFNLLTKVMYAQRIFQIKLDCCRRWLPLIFESQRCLPYGGHSYSKKG